MIKEFIVNSNITVKDFLKDKISSNLLIKITEKNLIFVNNQNVYNYYVMKPGDVLKIIIPKIDTNVKATKGDIEILYEDDYLIILNKPNNMATIPTRKHYNISLSNYLAYYYILKGLNLGIHFYSRLDYATSGIVMVAKNIYVLDLLVKTKITKKYLLKVHGEMDDAYVETKIIKDPNSIIKRMNVTGNTAKTTFKTMVKTKEYSIVEATLHTGKTHQIRLHTSFLNHPIYGDELYGINDSINLLHLHSYYLEFIHPITKEKIIIKNNPSWLDF